LAARRYFARAITQSPFFLRTYIALILLLKSNSRIKS
jgi:hypothetical protein